MARCAPFLLAGERSTRGLGHLAAVEGPSKLQLIDLTTGKAVEVGPSSRNGCPPAIDARGLVYAVNPPGLTGPGKLEFVPMPKLLAMVS